jgi:two-component system chemotaxis response regulator CheB
MGKDGAEGAALIEQKGGRIFVQDEATSVVYGMPRVARERTQRSAEFPLGSIASALAGAVSAGARS